MAVHIMLAIARELKRSINGTYADTNRCLSWVFARFQFWRLSSNLYWANLFKHTFNLFFCLLVHRLAVKISLPFYILYKLFLYWSRSTTCGKSGNTQRFVAVELMLSNKRNPRLHSKTAKEQANVQEKLYTETRMLRTKRYLDEQ